MSMSSALSSTALAGSPREGARRGRARLACRGGAVSVLDIFYRRRRVDAEKSCDGGVFVKINARGGKY